MARGVNLARTAGRDPRSDYAFSEMVEPGAGATTMTVTVLDVWHDKR